MPLLSGLTRGAAVRSTALSPAVVADIVKAAAAAAGQPAEIVAALGGHSLRAGLATAADAARVPEPTSGRVLGHAGSMTATRKQSTVRHHGGRQIITYGGGVAPLRPAARLRTTVGGSP